MPIPVTCQHCGKVEWHKPSYAKRAKYCSDECKYAGRRAKAEHTCPKCNTVFYRPPSRRKFGRGIYCSRKCQYASLEHLKRNPEKHVELTCIGCGDGFSLAKSKLSAHKGAGKYCSRECRDANRVGEQHPQFINGDGTYYHRGPNWQSQRRKARKRDDFTCQHCGEPGECVHHIRPFRYFDDYKEANRLRNLVTLCSPCHRTADAAIQATEREAALLDVA